MLLLRCCSRIYLFTFVVVVLVVVDINCLKVNVPFGMAQSSAAAVAAAVDDVAGATNLKSKVNGSIGDGNDSTTFAASLPSPLSPLSKAELLLQDGLSCTELFKNGDGLTYK